MQITALEKQERRQRVNVCLDGVYSFSLSVTVLAEEGLHIGTELTAEQVQALQEADARYTGYQAALRLLSIRPRSEKDLRERLQRRRVPPVLIEEIIEKLRGQGYVDDAEFARSWVETRELTSPRSKRLLVWELRRKGIAGETVAAATEAISDDDAAYRAVAKRARTLRSADAEEFRRRLGDFLLRRGFSWDTVRRTTSRLWEELHSEQLEPDTGFVE